MEYLPCWSPVSVPPFKSADANGHLKFSFDYITLTHKCLVVSHCLRLCYLNIPWAGSSVTRGPVKCNLSGPTSDLLNQNQHLNTKPRGVVCIVKFEQHASIALALKFVSIFKLAGEPWNIAHTQFPGLDWNCAPRLLNAPRWFYLAAEFENHHVRNNRWLTSSPKCTLHLQKVQF